MTLILGLLSRWGAVHVSDRLVTERVTSAAGTSSYRGFDAFSNKTVVLRGRDALVTLGYSGRAYLDDLPTDTWIAQTLLGTSLAGRSMFSLNGDTGPPVNLGVQTSLASSTPTTPPS